MKRWDMAYPTTESAATVSTVKEKNGVKPAILRFWSGDLSRPVFVEAKQVLRM